VVGKSCPEITSKCFLTDYDSTCPPAEGPPPIYCGAGSYPYEDRNLRTYCSVSCGGNLTIDYPGCGLLSQQCCASDEEFIPAPTPIPGTTGGPITPGFDLCKQTGRFIKDCQTCLNDGRGVWTAVGCIPTGLSSSGESVSATPTIRAFIALGLGISGGVVVIMVLAGSFMLATSQGDPKRVDEGKNLITSAIAGLLFVIFSVTLLRFIGVDLLRIPGFGGIR
jgi:hypothetical protein